MSTMWCIIVSYCLCVIVLKSIQLLKEKINKSTRKWKRADIEEHTEKREINIGAKRDTQSACERRVALTWSFWSTRAIECMYVGNFMILCVYICAMSHGTKPVFFAWFSFLFCSVQFNPLFVSSYQFGFHRFFRICIVRFLFSNVSRIDRVRLQSSEGENETTNIWNSLAAFGEGKKTNKQNE